MNHPDHGHPKNHDHGHHQHHGKKGLHKDWRAWAVVILMLAAMAMYLLTMDESIAPGEGEGERVPAAAGP